MSFIGDYVLEDTFYFNFTTRAFATGIPTVLIDTPSLGCIEDDNDTPITAGLTLGVSHASVVGLNNVKVIAASASGYETGKGYSVYIVAGEVDSVSVIGEVVGHFTIGMGSLAAVKADTAATLVDTAVIGALGVGLTDLGGMSTAMIAEVKAAVADYMTDIHLDHLLAVDAADVVVDDSAIAQLAATAGDWSDFAKADDSLQAIRDHANTIKTETAAILDDTDLIDDGTSGLAKIATDVAAVLVDTETTIPGTLEGLTLFGKSSVDDTGNSTTKVDLGAANAGSYSDDELNGFFLVLFDNGASEYHVREITDYTATGELATVATLPFTPATDDFYWLLSAQAGSSSAPTAAAVADAVWDEAATGHTDAGKAGEQLWTDVDAILADTGELQADDVPTLIATAQSDLDTITGTSGVLIGTDAANVTEISDAVWDETLTGSNHNIASSAGKRLRQVEEAFVHHSGALGTVTDARTMILTGGVATDDYYLGDRLQITEGTGLGQSRVIIKYVGSTATATLDSDFITTPVATTSLFDVVAADVHVATSDADLAEGYLASVADASNVTMDAITSVSATDYYKGDLIVITHGTGIGQSREIISQTGRALVVSPAFVTTPDTTSAFHVVAMISADEITTEVWDRDATGHQTGGTFGQAIGDPGANAETMYDAVVTDAAGTNVAADVIAVKSETAAILDDTDLIDDGTSGLAKIATDVAAALGDTVDIQSRIPAALSSGNMKADVLAISTSTAAANNLEASTEVIIIGAAEAGTLTTEIMTTDLTESTDDHYNGRIIIWTSGVLIGQATDILDYLGSTGQLTYTAVTEAPTAADTFVIM